MLNPLALLLTSALVLQPQPAAPRVGPPRGTVIVVGGGQVGPEILARFIAAAGGPDALIIDVPTAGGDSVYPPDWRGANSLKRAGARNVVVLHTIDRKLADSDSFAAPLQRAGGVWFEGGRQWHLVDSYAGTQTEQGFHAVLARGGVVGGSSAGASILASYLLRGARSGNSIIMAPGYEKGFGFLRGTAIDQHVVARERLRDLADSLLPKHPELLGLSEDEGTAWVVQGDTAEIVGRNKAFVYGGKATDEGKPFLTLFPGDRYDLAARRVMRRAIDGSQLSERFVDSLLSGLPAGRRATVLVAQDGKVLVDKGYNIPPHPRYMPATTVPNFPLEGLAEPLNALASQLRGRDTLSYLQLVTRRIYTPIGMRKTTLDTTGGGRRFASNVDELYRLELGLQFDGTWVRDTLAASSAGAAAIDPALGWRTETSGGVIRLAQYATEQGRRNAFVRIPERRLAVIILSDSEELDARGIAERIVGRLLGER
jgi:cyanophycinase